jgi:hypothetical protein
VGYDWIGRRVQFNARGGSGLRYYQKSGEFMGSSHFGAFDLAAEAGRVQISLKQTVGYSPAYFYGLMPLLPTSEAGAEALAGGGYAVNALRALVSDTSAGLSKRVSARSSLTAFGSFRHASYSGGENRPPLQSYGIGGRFTRDLSRAATLRLGYTYRNGQYGEAATDRPTIAHDIDVGVDYHRPLSFSRRTRLEFGFGSSIVNTPVEDSSKAVLEYRVVGNASLSHDMGRTWRTRLAYNRGVGFVAAFGAPVFSDGVNTSIDGFVNRRVDVHVSGGISVGDVGRGNGAASKTHSYNGSARFNVALGRAWALFADYLYYDYRLGADVNVVTGVPQSLTRNTARVGLSAWLPLLKR